jgi:glycerol-3-phosphate dehydrogenase (NAD(P)+)
MGDLVLTCTGDLSRNRAVGIELARGRSLESIVSGMKEVAEGIRTASAVAALAQRHGVEMPIATAVSEVLAGELAPADAAERLMRRQLRSENE